MPKLQKLTDSQISHLHRKRDAIVGELRKQRAALEAAGREFRETIDKLERKKDEKGFARGAALEAADEAYATLVSHNRLVEEAEIELDRRKSLRTLAQANYDSAFQTFDSIQAEYHLAAADVTTAQAERDTNPHVRELRKRVEKLERRAALAEARIPRTETAETVTIPETPAPAFVEARG